MNVICGCGAVAPVPVSGTVCGEFGRLSATNSCPLRVPVTVGVNVTETVQVAPMLDPQVLVANAKLPVTEMVTGRLEPVELVSVIDWGALVVPTIWLAKANDEGLKVTPPAAVPVPLSDTICGEPAALSVMLSVGLQVPTAVG